MSIHSEEVRFFHPFIAEWLHSQGWRYDYEVNVSCPKGYSGTNTFFRIDFIAYDDVENEAHLIECKKTLLQGQNVPRIMERLDDCREGYIEMHGNTPKAICALVVPESLYTGTHDYYADQNGVLIVGLDCPPELIAKFKVLTREQFDACNKLYKELCRQANASFKADKTNWSK